MTTISWNINGFFNHLPELQLLTAQYEPDFICLQETHLKPNNITNHKIYNIYRKDRQRNTYGGVAILVHKRNHSEQINLNTNLEAIAIRIKYPEECTLCSVYIAPNEDLQQEQINDLIKSLPQPYILTGDLNAHNPIWDNALPHRDAKGKIIEKLLDENNILNDGRPTHFSSQHGTFSAIDITLCDPIITPRLLWETTETLFGSDHFPILIRNLTKTKQKTTTNEKWNLNKANWTSFAHLLEQEDILLHDETDINKQISHCTQTIKQVGYNTIKIKTKPHNNNRNVPWWDKELEHIIKQNKKILNLYRRKPTLENFIELKKKTILQKEE